LADIVEEPSDGTPGFDAIVARHGRRKVTSAGTNPDGTEPVWIDLRAFREKPERGAEVFDLAPRMLVLTRQALALSKVPVIEGERHETACSHRDGVVASRLLLHAGHRTAKHQGRGRSRTERHAQHAHDIDRFNLEGDSLFSNRWRSHKPVPGSVEPTVKWIGQSKRAPTKETGPVPFHGGCGAAPI
jgi:hypothetical protein